jgi:hypothetical protein
MRSFHLILSAGLLTGMAAFAQAGTPDRGASIVTAVDAAWPTSQNVSEESKPSSVSASQASFKEYSSIVAAVDASWPMSQQPSGALDPSSDPSPVMTFNWGSFIGTGQGACLESGACS